MSVSQSALTPVEIARLSGRIDRPLVLVGLMGVGKTTVGRKLANLLDCDFVDADEEIEQASQMSIAEIFDQYGEDYFRDGERRVVARLIEEGHGVIATGGGAFCAEDTRELILDKAIAIWLDSDIETLVERTGRKNSRPLLEGGDAGAILRDLHTKRAPDYGMAPIRVMSSEAPHYETAMRILEAVERWQ